MVGIVIVNYNRPRDTLNCLRAISQLAHQDFVVAVVDNGSSKKDRERLLEEIGKSFSPRKYTPILLNENLGYAHGCNEGIKVLIENYNPQFIWILNNDTLPRPNSLTEFLSCAESGDRKIGIWGGKLLYPDGETIQAIGGIYLPEKAKGLHIGAGEKDRGQYDDPLWAEKMDYIVGASMFVRREFIDDVGVMNEEYFLFYEELDWILRGKQKGWRIGYCPRAVVLHNEGATIKKHDLSDFEVQRIYFYSIRNKLIFTKRFFPEHYLKLKWRLCWQMVKELKKGNKVRAKILFQLLFSPTQAERKYAVAKV